MRYLPHTREDIEEMLRVVGVETIDDLFKSVPADCRCENVLDLPEEMSEWDLNSHMDALAGKMAVSPDYMVFVGAGRYDHYIPAILPHLLSRSEFSTAYTPYQPEISQGTLQGIYEYQTLCARLLGMDVATGSHYDGATALAEALLMAVRKTKRQKVAVSRLCHPFYREVIQTYLRPTGCEMVEIPYGPDGQTNLEEIGCLDDVAAIAVQSPNFFGIIENLNAFAQIAHGAQALFITSFTEAIAYGLLKNPGSQGADIVAGEGQSLGISIAFGGPGLGMLASKQEFMRQLPGRLVGQTKDLDGKRGFVLTLAAREQHIRREKATSNICSNNGLCAMTAAMFMASLGGTGFKRLSKINFNKSEYLKNRLNDKGIEIPFSAPTFNEFIVRLPRDFKETYTELMGKKIVAGLPVSTFYPELEDHYLLCVTETMSRQDMDALVREI